MRLVVLAILVCLSGVSDALAQDNPPPPTFARDVAPLVFANCSPCHRPGGDAPFALTSYAEVRSRASLIADATRRRYMPPWKPAPDGGGPFLGARRLTDEQIATLTRWATTGMAEGDPTGLRASTAAVREWQVGTPDLIVEMADTYELPAGGADVFRTFVIRVPVTETRYVAAIELRPGTRAAHHANIRFDRADGSRALDAADPLPGYEGPVSPTARYPDGYFLGWTPGQRAHTSPQSMAWRLEPGSDLVVQLHLRKTGKPENVRPGVGFVFTDQTPARPPFALRLGRQDIDMAAGQRYVVRDVYRLPVDVEVHSIHPHAHYRATDIRAIAELPDGTRRPLIHIPDWDFNWQDIYRYEAPVALPRGTSIAMEYTYDNSASNVRNPDRVPRRVIFGQNSSDEMGDLWLQVVTRTAEDRARLVGDMMPKILAEDAVGYGMLLQADPGNVGLARGKAATEYNLGTLLTAERRFEEAAAHLRTAGALRPEHGDTHNNLGVALRALGQPEAALERFREAVRLDPSNDAAAGNLADALLQQLIDPAKDVRAATRAGAMAALGDTPEIRARSSTRRAAALALFDGLDDPERYVRIAALRSLTNIGGWDYDAAHAAKTVRVTRELAEVAAGNPGDAALHRALGTAYLLNEEPELAARALEVSLTLEPDGPGTRYLLGLARLGQRRPADAGVLFRQVPATDPYYPNAQEQLKQIQ